MHRFAHLIFVASLIILYTRASVWADDSPKIPGEKKDGVLSSCANPPPLGLPASVRAPTRGPYAVYPSLPPERFVCLSELPEAVRAAILKGAPNRLPEIVVARVNSRPIFLPDVVPPLIAETSCLPLTTLFKKVLDHLINRELMYQDAVGKLERFNPKGYKKLCEIQKAEFQKRISEIQARNHISKEQFVESLSRRGVTFEQYERNETRNFFADEYLRSRVFYAIQNGTTYPELLSYYKKHPNEFQHAESVDWQDIFIAVGTPRAPTWDEARQLTTEVERRLHNDESIEGLLEIDDGFSRLRDGQGMGHVKGQIDPPELEAVLFGMKIGQVKTVKIRTGYHVIRLTRRIEGGLTSFSTEVREALFHKLANEIAERERKRIIAELRAKAVIEIVHDHQPNTSTH